MKARKGLRWRATLLHELTDSSLTESREFIDRYSQLAQDFEEKWRSDLATAVHLQATIPC
jgi:hypothetical protein